VELARRQVRIRGVVQGVGFRPFVHNLARRLGLAGYVLNSSAGVMAEVEGTADALDRIRREPAQRSAAAGAH
jgi:hydrogenase maturation protein HypF